MGMSTLKSGTIALLGLALLLAGCRPGTQADGPKTDSAVNNATAANDSSTLKLAPGETIIVSGGSTPLQPGLWSISHSGLADAGGRPTTASTQCLSGIDAAQPPAAFLAARKGDGSCKFENLAGEDNQLFVTIRCEGAAPFVIVASGTITPTAIDLIGGDTAKADTRITARRIGDCSK
jgi:hypothetical protein